MSDRDAEFRQHMDRTQNACLRDDFKNREAVVSYANAAVNSAVGAVTAHYGSHEPEVGKAAAIAVLQLWIATIKGKS